MCVWVEGCLFFPPPLLSQYRFLSSFCRQKEERASIDCIEISAWWRIELHVAAISFILCVSRKEQTILSPVNCWNLLLLQVKRESRDHATLSDLYLNNIIPRFAQISEDSGRLFKKVTHIHSMMIPNSSDLNTKWHSLFIFFLLTDYIQCCYMTTVNFNLSPQSKEVGVQLQEDLIKVLNELYAVRKSTIKWGSMFKIGCLASTRRVMFSYQG